MKKIILILLGLAFGIAVQDVQAENSYDKARENSDKLFGEMDRTEIPRKSKQSIDDPQTKADRLHQDSDTLEGLDRKYQEAEGAEKDLVRKKIAETILRGGPMKLLKKNKGVRVRTGEWVVTANLIGKKAIGTIAGTDGSKSDFDFPIQ